MRIAMIVGTFGKISEKFVLDQIAGLIDLGHEVEIFARSVANEAIVHPDVVRYGLREKLHVLGIPSGGSWRYILRALIVAVTVIPHHPILVFKMIFSYWDWDALFLLAKLHDRKFDLVFAQFGPNGELAAQLKKAGMRWPLLTIFRGYDIRQAVQRGAKIYSSLFRVGDLFLGVSQDIVAQLCRLGVAAERIRHLPGGVDLDKFHPPSDRKPWEPSQRLVLLTVARLHQVKGLAYGIRAFKALVERNHDLNLEYRLVGAGPQEKELRQLVGDLGLEKEVLFLGPFAEDQVASQYRQAHLFMLPSVAEGLPVVAQEAMASELPVVATVVGGVGELLVHGETGLLVPPKDAQALADGLQQLIDSRDTWQELGQRGRRLVASKYEIKQQNRELEQICLRLVAHARNKIPVESVKNCRAGMVTAIIPVRNRSDELAGCLSGLLSQWRHFPLQVIVVDDASTDDGTRNLAALHPQVTYIRTDVPRGSAFAKNLGLSLAEGEFVLFLDSDVTFLSNTTLQTMVATMSDDLQCGQVGGEAIVDCAEKVKFIFGRHIDEKTGMSQIQFIPAEQAGSRRFRCDYVPTSNCMVRRDVALHVCGFDDAYSSLGEDKDFGYRVKQLGLRSYVLSDSAVWHHFSTTGRTGSGLRKQFRTQIRFILRHFGLSGVVKMLPGIFLEAVFGRTRAGNENSDPDVQRFQKYYRETLLQLKPARNLIDTIWQNVYRGGLFLSAVLWNVSKTRRLRPCGSIHFDFQGRNSSGIDSQIRNPQS